MSFVHSEAKGDFAQGFQKSYVSTKAFNSEFQTYTTSMDANFQTVGTLSAVAGATAANCPANRVLHFTGRKLVPGQHPNVSRMLVSVYDPVSFLNGFIDPSSSAFAKYDQNMPNSFNDGRNGSSVPPLGGQAAKLTLADAGQQLEPITNAPVDAGNASVGQVVMVGTTCTVLTTAATASSKVFLTQSSSGPAALAVTAQSAGSFTITGGSGVTVNWLVVN